MKRYIPGLNQANTSPNGIPDGVVLARVERARCGWDAQKPFYALVFSILEPNPLVGNGFAARLYCTPKELWKLNWFLRDFGYDSELLDRCEIDDQRVIGLEGVVQISHTVMNGTSLLNLEALAPLSRWKEFSNGISTVPFHAEVKR